MKKNSRRSTMGNGKDNKGCEEAVLGGTEIHVKFTRQYGDPGLFLTFSPPVNAEGVLEGIEDINGRLAGLCHEKILDMKDQARLRLLALAERDGGNDRMLYRLVVKAWTEEDGSHGTRVVDFVDPEFARLDAGVTGRALACRQEIERVLGGGMPAFSGAASPEDPGDDKARPSPAKPETVSTEPDVRQIPDDPVDDDDAGIPAGTCVERMAAPPRHGKGEPPTLKVVGIVENFSGSDGRSREEVERGMLEGEEFMILELQVMGSIGRNGRADWMMFEYFAEVSGTAFETPWMQEKILSLSKVCEETVMAIDPVTNQCLSHSLRGEGVREKCLYRLSVWGSLLDDGSIIYCIRDTIDPLFGSQDSTSGVRAIEARRLAGMVIGGIPQ